MYPGTLISDMKKIKLGKTGLWVSPLGIGTLTLGPYQLNMPVKQGAELIVEAVRGGVNLIDTAKAYRTYPYVKKALQMMHDKDRRGIHLIGRSYDYSAMGMEKSFKDALESMGVERISIFMLHEMESELTLKGHREALKYLVKMKKSGLLSAVGVSTHYIAAVEAASLNPDVDVIFAILNREGLGIMDGTRRDMEKALREAYCRGKGILLMKALGGGHLFRKPVEALTYARNFEFAHSTIIGMQNKEELEYNLSFFNGVPTRNLPQPPKKQKKKLFIEPWCVGCGKCVEACPFEALRLEGGKVSVDREKCVLCSYCARACADFCIKVV